MRVSVIVPTYNRAALIGETVASILAQSRQPDEVIVIDDGSTDRTEPVVRSFGSRVRYVRIENGGVGRARNVGVSLSSAAWIAFCDSDDLWHPDKLALQTRLVESADDVEYVFTNFRTVVNGVWSDATKFDSSPAGYWGLRRRELSNSLFVIESPLFGQILIHQPVFPSTVMMKRSFFDAVGGWNEAIGRMPGEDFEFALRCMLRAPVGVVGTPMVGIRKHASNFSGDVLRTTLGEIQILHHVLDKVAAAREHADAIREQIMIRSAAAAEVAFGTGDLKLTRELARAVPYSRRSWRLHVKWVIAWAPMRASRVMSSVAVNAKAAWQMWRSRAAG